MSARRPWRYRQAAALAKLEAELRAAEKRSLAQDKQHDEAIAALRAAYDAVKVATGMRDAPTTVRCSREFLGALTSLRKPPLELHALAASFPGSWFGGLLGTLRSRRSPQLPQSTQVGRPRVAYRTNTSLLIHTSSVVSPTNLFQQHEIQ